MTDAPRIIFEDTHLVVLSKPAGMLSQGDISESENLVDWLRNYWGRHYVGLIHRLDRNTSGLMVVAKRTKSATRLSEALQKGDLKRSYLAWVDGKLETSKTWTHWLLKNEKTNEVRVVKKNTPGAKEAILNVVPEKLGIFKQSSVTLAKFVLETGRSHQIRVQSAEEGYPVLGDLKYGTSRLDVSVLLSRTALHSYQIEFPHPMTKEVMKFQDHLPADFKKAEEIFLKEKGK